MNEEDKEITKKFEVGCYELIEKLTEENKQLKDNWNIFDNHLEFLIMNSIGGTKELIEDLLNLSKILRGKDEFRESN